MVHTWTWYQVGLMAAAEVLIGFVLGHAWGYTKGKREAKEEAAIKAAAETAVMEKPPGDAWKK